MTPDAPRGIFVHVPKTAGRTVIQVILKKFPQRAFAVNGNDLEGSIARWRTLPTREQEETRMAFGHMPFGLDALLGGSWSYASMLRNPVDRIISHYWYVRRTPGSELHRDVVEHGRDLEDYVLRSRFQDIINNGQTAHLGNPFTQVARPATRESLVAAKRNVEQRFAVLGLAERFDESLLLMADAFGWSHPFYTPANVAPFRPRVADLDPHTLEVIMERNQLDIELHEWASRRFQEQVERQPAGFRRRVESFRLANRTSRVAISKMQAADHFRKRAVRKALSLFEAGR